MPAACRSRRRLAVPLLALAAVLVPAPAAFGHAAFEGASPPPGGRVETVPARIELRFTEPLNAGLTEATLLTAGGKQVDARQAVRGRRVVLVPARALGRGAYRVRWRTVSTEDSHPLEGSFGFGVRAPPAAGGAAVEQSPLAAGGWFRALIRALLYAALLLFAGALFSRALLGRDWPAGPPRSRPPDLRAPDEPASPPTRPAAPSSGVATLAPPVRAASAPPTGARERADGLVLDAGLATASLAAGAAIVDSAIAAGGLSLRALGDYLLEGTAGLARAALVGLALAALALSRRAPRAAAVAALAALGCIVASGHANSADPRGLAIVADWAHLVAAAAWLGGAALIVLAWGLSLRDAARRHDVARDVLPAFGRIALPAFALVVAAGTVNAVVELGSVSDLWDTAYGRVLTLKIALVAAAALAALSHVRRQRRPDASGDRGLWRALRAEVLLGAGVAAAAGLLVAFPLPPRQLDAVTGAARGAVACDPCPLPAARGGELAVGEQAGSLVVAAWIRRGAGRLTGTVRTLDIRGRPAQGSIEVLGGQARGCGTGCARFDAPTAANGSAGEVLRVRVRDRGRRFAAALPATWLPGRSAEARRLLRRAERTMRGLRSVRESERTSSGPGQVALTRYALRAPDRLFLATDRGVRTIQIGRRQWVRLPGTPWRAGPVPGGVPFRTRSWFRWTPYARSVELLGRRGGVAYVAAADPATPVWFRLAIEERTGRVLHERLVARARRIEHRFFGFNSPVTIAPPRNAVRAG